MIIKELRVKNYRSIKDATLTLGKLTALVGRNGAGKSNFLNALELFFDQSKKPDVDDFFGRQEGQPIEVEVTFINLDVTQQEKYGGYVNGNEMTVARVLELDDKQARYRGSVLQHPKFAEIRQSTGSQTEKRGKFNELVDTEEFPGLTQTARSWQRVEELMNEWEDSHRDQLKRIPKRIDQKETQFFGFAGGSLIGQDINIIRVPAVREAQDDAADKGQSPVAQLMEAVVRRTLADRRDYRAFVNRAESDAKRLIGTLKTEVIDSLREELNANMRMYAPSSTVGLELSYDELIDVKPPRAGVSLEEDGFATDVGRSGHGVQRAFIFATLQQLNSSRRASEPTETSDDDSDVGGASTSVPTTILAIDEPELYQHPSRQRHIASTLRDLASGGDDGRLGHVQVIFTTHSPHFVSLDRCDDVRVIRKSVCPDANAMATETTHANLGKMASCLQEASVSDREFSTESLRARLKADTNPLVNEGFFAETVVLVEGETDRAVLRKSAKLMGHDFDALDVSVIPCGGKTSLDRPLVAFQALGIPSYIVWDGDGGKDDQHPETNESIMRLLGLEPDHSPCFIGRLGACFLKDLEATLKHEWGDDFYGRAIANARRKLEVGANAKNERVYEHAVEFAFNCDMVSTSVKSVVDAIVKLRNDNQLESQVDPG